MSKKDVPSEAQEMAIVGNSKIISNPIVKDKPSNLRNSIRKERQLAATKRSQKGVKTQVMTSTARDNRRTAAQERASKYNTDKSNATSRANVAAQLAQSEKESKRKMGTDIIKALIGLVPNDPDWYKNLPEAAGFIPNVKTLIPGGMPRAPQGYRRPQVLCIKYDNVFGPSDDVKYSSRLRSNPLNAAATRLLTNARAHSSRTLTNDEAADFFQYLISATDVMVHFVRLMKAVKAAYTFDYNNKGIGDQIIAACGFNAANIRANLPQIKAWMMTRQEDMASLIVVPNSKSMLSYIDRKLWLAAGVYKEDDNPTPQYVVTCPNRWMLYDEANAVVLQNQFIPYGQETFANFSSLFEIRLNTFRYSATILSLVSDLKASGIPIFELPRVTEDYLSKPLEFGSLSEVKHQFMNATLPAFISEHSSYPYSSFMNNNNYESEYALSDATIAVRQDTDGLLYVGASLADTVYMYTSKKNSPSPDSSLAIGYNNAAASFIKSYEDDLDADDFLVYTRLMCTYEVENTSNVNAYFQSTFIKICGTEAVSHLVFSSAGNMIVGSATIFFNAMAFPLDYQWGITSVFSDFDFLPTMLQYSVSDDGSISVPDPSDSYEFVYSKGADYALPSENLDMTHKVAFASEFYIDPSKKFIR